MNRRWPPLVGLVMLLLPAGTLLADGVMLNGVSPRSIGRGGTNLAYADNGAILFDNPAAAVNFRGQRLVDVGVDMLIADFHYADPRNDSAGDDSVFPLFQAGLIRKSPSGQWAYGLGMYVPAGFAEAFDLEGPPPLVGVHHYRSLGTLAKFLPGVAFRATDRLSVGATLGAAVSHDELEGPYFLQNAGLGPVPMLLDLQATGAALCWSVGLQYQLTDATSLGLAYQSESRFHAEGPTRVAIPLLGQSSYDTRLDITWPRSLGVGVRHELCPHHILSTDLIWFDWSSAFDDFGIRLTNPSNPFFPSIEERLPLRWRDTVSVRLGYERHFCGGRVFRCGYTYHRNPIPDGTLTPYIQAILEHAFSMGYGWTWRCWNIDLSYMFAFGQDRFVATSDLVGGAFDQSYHRAQTHCIAFSFMRRF